MRAAVAAAVLITLIVTRSPVKCEKCGAEQYRCQQFAEGMAQPPDGLWEVVLVRRP